jgi:hypothetical protein
LGSWWKTIGNDQQKAKSMFSAAWEVIRAAKNVGGDGGSGAEVAASPLAALHLGVALARYSF